MVPSVRSRRTGDWVLERQQLACQSHRNRSPREPRSVEELEALAEQAVVWPVDTNYDGSGRVGGDAGTLLPGYTSAPLRQDANTLKKRCRCCGLHV